MTWRGMDTESVEALSAALQEAGARVEALEARLTARLAGTEWIGLDATRFRDDWDARLRPTLAGAQDALVTAARIADAHVDNQTAASS